MPELDTTIVEQYTQGRLLNDDPETERALAAALACVRRYCGWHVTPSRTETITVNGPNSPLLALPTLYLTALTAVTEDDVVLDTADLRWSVNGLIRKKTGAYWSSYYRSIVVTMTHGYDTAPDFDNAVLSALDRASFGNARMVAGPFQYDPQGPSEEEKYALEAYRIQPIA